MKVTETSPPLVRKFQIDATYDELMLLHSLLGATNESIHDNSVDSYKMYIALDSVLGEPDVKFDLKIKRN